MQYAFNADSENGLYYLKWIYKLIGNSNRCPSYDELLVRYPECNNMNYWDFLNAFATDPTKPDYNYPVLPTLAPAAFNDVSSKINSNPCN